MTGHLTLGDRHRNDQRQGGDPRHRHRQGRGLRLAGASAVPPLSGLGRAGSQQLLVGRRLGGAPVPRSGELFADDIAAVALSGLVGVTLPVSDQGKPLRPAMIWMDSRIRGRMRGHSPQRGRGRHQQEQRQSGRTVVHRSEGLVDQEARAAHLQRDAQVPVAVGLLHLSHVRQLHHEHRRCRSRLCLRIPEGALERTRRQGDRHPAREVSAALPVA